MNLNVFGEQPEVVWIWIGCGAIAIVNHTYPQLDLGGFGVLATIGFVLPIVAMVLVFALKADNAAQR